MDKKLISIAILVVAVLLLAGCACPLRQGRTMHHEKMVPMISGPLDGMTYEGQVGMPGEATGETDILTFNDGYFHSSACDQYGFGKGMYLAVTTVGTTTFQARTWNRKGATILWNGTIKGEMLEGDMTLYEQGKEPVKHWVKATMK